MKNKFWLIFLVVVAIILWSSAFFILMMRVANAQISDSRPRRGEWLCWVTNVKAECGTYGWHKRQPVALKAAFDLCEKQCGVGCTEDYCEVLK